MFWAGTIEDRLVGLAMAFEVIKLKAAAYSNLLNESMKPWLDHILLSLLRTLAFMHEVTKAF